MGYRFLKKESDRLDKQAEKMTIEFKGMKFKVLWCDVCIGKYVECPRCGNNTCNGGHGEDGKCPVCSIAYDIIYDIDRAASIGMV